MLRKVALLGFLGSIEARLAYCDGVHANPMGYVGLDSAGSITSWDNGPRSAPSGSGFTSIVPSGNSYVALDADGRITPFSADPNAPTGTGYVRVFSTRSAFVALHSSGTLSAWGNAAEGGSGAPSGTFTKVAATFTSFAAISSAGCISTWGNSAAGGSGGPSRCGYTKIVASEVSFSALHSDGSISAWGQYITQCTWTNQARNCEGTAPPTGNDWVNIYSNRFAFVALNSTGGVAGWGRAGFGAGENLRRPGPGAEQSSRAYPTYRGGIDRGRVAPSLGCFNTGNRSAICDGYTQIYASLYAFCGIHGATGSIYCWGHSHCDYGACGFPCDNGQSGGNDGTVCTGYVSMASNDYQFAALHSTGTIATWPRWAWTDAHRNLPSTWQPGWFQWTRSTPLVTPSGYTKIVASKRGFAALHSTGRVDTWGDTRNYNVPQLNNGVFVDVMTSMRTYAAVDAQGLVTTFRPYSTVVQTYGPDLVSFAPGQTMHTDCDGANGGTGGAVQGDPHLSLPHGGKADFRGEHKAIYNFLSARHLSVNVMTEMADFELHPANHSRHKDVHGSFITQVHIISRTKSGKTVRVSFWADAIGPKNIGSANGTVDSEPSFFLQKMIKSEKKVDDTTLRMDYSSLHAITPEFEIVVTPQKFRLERNVVGLHHRLDVSIKRRIAEADFAVPPHGIIGQAWDGDGKAIDGEQDLFPVSGEFTTYAMAKGAIEGVPNDYKMAAPFSTEFKFSRFDAISAKPRNVAALVASGELNAPKKVPSALGEVVGVTEYNFTDF